MTGDTACSLYAQLVAAGLVEGPVIIVAAGMASLSRRALATATGTRRPLFFRPRSSAALPFEDRPPSGEDLLHLADRSRDGEEAVENDRAVVATRSFRLRRADELFAGLRDCALLAVADAEYNFEIIDGAVGLIRRTEPIVLVETAGLSEADRAAQLAALSRHLGSEYAIFGRPGRSSAILYLPRHARGALPSRSIGREEESAFVLADAALVARNLWAPETNGSTFWRWSGPRSRIRVALPVERPGPHEIVVPLVNWRDPALAEIAAFIDGTRASAVILRADGVPTGVAVRATLPGFGFRGWITLDLVHGPTEPSGTAGDERRLGLCLGGFAIRALPGSG